MNKQNILDNVTEYSAEQLFVHINEGTITLDELIQNTDGELDATKRRRLTNLIANSDTDTWENVIQTKTLESVQYYLDTFPHGVHRSDARILKEQLEVEIQNKQMLSTENSAWTNIDKNSKDDLSSFINKYPNSIHLSEANILANKLSYDEIMGVDADTLISEIRKLQTDKTLTSTQKGNNIISTIEEYINIEKIAKKDFLNIIKEDNNLLSAGIIMRLINNNTITQIDLIEIGIDKSFIKKMFNKEVAQSFSTPAKLNAINKQSTEVYFWGIPSSGKSCALGAILSVAASGKVAKSMDPDIGSQGYGYMTKLINLFQHDEIVTLIEGTPIDSFYEMGFDLVDAEDRIHPITCIDMAGELMRCMYKKNAGDEMSDTDEIMLDTLTNVLLDNRSANRKMHIFVIEYGAEDRLYEGLPQKVYLDGALSYIKSTGILKRETDAIYLMITKADKIKHDSKKEAINQYIEEKYLGFYNGLEKICKDNEINKGRVEKLAFSLGNVCFQNYCRFDSVAAKNVVRLILDRSANYKGGKRGMFVNIFRK